MVNKVILIGNLGNDPEIRKLENGTTVAKMSIATNENYKDSKGEWQTITDWHDIVMWRVLAERAEASLNKGTMIYVEGRLKTRTWEDEDKKKRRTTEVIADLFRILNKRESSPSGYMPSADDMPQTSSQHADNSNAANDENDLPF